MKYLFQCPPPLRRPHGVETRHREGTGDVVDLDAVEGPDIENDDCPRKCFDATHREMRIIISTSSISLTLLDITTRHREDTGNVVDLDAEVPDIKNDDCPRKCFDATHREMRIIISISSISLRLLDILLKSIRLVSFAHIASSRAD